MDNCREVAMSPTLLNSRSTAADDVSDVLHLIKTVWTASGMNKFVIHWFCFFTR